MAVHSIRSTLRIFIVAVIILGVLAGWLWARKVFLTGGVPHYPNAKRVCDISLRTVDGISSAQIVVESCLATSDTLPHVYDWYLGRWRRRPTFHIGRVGGEHDEIGTFGTAGSAADDSCAYLMWGVRAEFNTVGTAVRHERSLSESDNGTTHIRETTRVFIDDRPFAYAEGALESFFSFLGAR